MIHAATEMDKCLDSFGLGSYNLDDLAPVMLDAYEIQQAKQKSDGTFSLLSFISMALLELGLIIEAEEE